MAKTTHYRTKKLIPGSVIGKDGQYVAIPEKGFKGTIIKVEYLDEVMYVKNWMRADAYRRFPDKWRKNRTYVLGYFRWQPTEVLGDFETHDLSVSNEAS